MFKGSNLHPVPHLISQEYYLCLGLGLKNFPSCKNWESICSVVALLYGIIFQNNGHFYLLNYSLIFIVQSKLDESQTEFIYI